MQAETLNCQNCGAAVASDNPMCAHCGSRLAAMVCPGCLHMMFRGSKFCPHCGRPGVEWKPTDSPLLCPSCEVPLLRGEAGRYALHECEKCFGIWVDNATRDLLYRDAEREAVPPSPFGEPVPTQSAPLPPVRYVRCPQCRTLMHRTNFAQSSGVILDVCRQHGTWFDAQELQRVVEFIRSGGLDRAREREKAELAAERRRVIAAAAARSESVEPEPPGLLARLLLSGHSRRRDGGLDVW